MTMVHPPRERYNSLPKQHHRRTEIWSTFLYIAQVENETNPIRSYLVLSRLGAGCFLLCKYTATNTMQHKTSIAAAATPPDTPPAETPRAWSEKMMKNVR